MVLFLTEQDVSRLLPMKECINVLEEAFLHEAQGKAENRPRMRIRLPKGFFHYMAGAVVGQGVLGIKVYSTMPGGARFLVLLYDADSGALLSIMQAGTLGQVRTGAASGVATKYLAREDASVVGVIGTGYQARTQLEAVCAVRKIKKAKCFSRTTEKRQAFATQMTQRLGADVVAVSSAEECVRGSDVVVTITNSREPVLLGQWLNDEMHINAAGSNHWMRREIDDAAVQRSQLIVVDNLEQAKEECGDLIGPAERGTFSWSQAYELKQVVSGQVKRNNREEVTLFESQGLAIEDVAAAAYVYRRAKQEGVGQELPI